MRGPPGGNADEARVIDRWRNRVDRSRRRRAMPLVVLAKVVKKRWGSARLPALEEASSKFADPGEASNVNMAVRESNRLEVYKT